MLSPAINVLAPNAPSLSFSYGGLAHDNDNKA
jgi:hypothetical protein